MKRRTLLGSAAMTLGGASVIGTGAFTSVEAERSVSVDVASDQNAFLKLGRCNPNSNDQGPIRSSDFVYSDNGTLTIDLTGAIKKKEGRGHIEGNGISSGSLWRFPNAFRIENQGTEDVCVDLQLVKNGETPSVGLTGNQEESVDLDGDGSDERTFSEGSPAVVFYPGSDDSPENRFTSNTLQTGQSQAIYLTSSDSQCIGFNIRTFGLDPGSERLNGLTLQIRADTGSECTESGGGGTGENGMLIYQNAETYGTSTGGNGNGNSRVKFDFSAKNKVTVTEIKITSPSRNKGESKSNKNKAESKNNITKIACSSCSTIESIDDGDMSYPPNYTSKIDIGTKVELEEGIEVPSDNWVTIGIGDFKTGSGRGNMNNGSAKITLYYDDGEETILLTNIPNNAD